MAYQLDLTDEVWHYLLTLPKDGRDLVSDALRVLELVPWNGPALYADKPDSPLRRLTFGPPGAGFVVYQIVEHDDRVDVLQLVWTDI